jgi:hypothetical protein
MSCDRRLLSSGFERPTFIVNRWFDLPYCLGTLVSAASPLICSVCERPLRKLFYQSSMSGTRKLSDGQRDCLSKRSRYDQGPDLTVHRTPDHAAPEQGLSYSRVQKPLWTPLTENPRQIRLLQMLDGGTHDQGRLRYRLTVQSLDEVADYYAVSYTWGRHELSEKVIVDESSCMVTLNCYQALAQVYRHWNRERLRSDLVWIDCLCINQYDTSEKNAQVSIIGDIFSNATEVLACLGSHRNNSELVFRCAREIADFGFACDHDDFLCHDCGLPWTKWVLSLGFNSLQKLCIACQDFGERDYWGRVWIVQEVSKASSLSIMCGDDMLPWKPLSELKTFLAMDMEEMPSITSEFDTLPSCETTPMYNVFAAKDIVISLTEAFDRYSASVCFDPRDHLYGLLSIIEWPEGMEQILPDYNMTPYSLALRLEAYVAVECFPDMLVSFQVGLNNPSLRHLVHRKRSRLGAMEQRTRAPESQEVKFRPAFGVQTGHLPVCGRLRTNSLGEMTASFVRMLDIEGSPGVIFVDPSSEPTQSPQIPLTQQLEESEWRLESASSLSGSDEVYRKLMLQTDLIGLICSEARADDILFPLPFGVSEVYENRVFIVLRPNYSDVYDIIGQAVLLHGYSLNRWNDTKDKNNLLQASTFEAQVDLKLSTEDYFVLFAQDYTGRGDEYDEQHRWKRVCTSITDTPVEAARVTIQVSPSIHEKDWENMTELHHQLSPEMFKSMTRGLHTPGYWLACQSLGSEVPNTSEKG